jgi:alanyl-tRNA synthetase
MSVSRQLRQSFLDFFAQRDHKVLPGASLKPTDETTLFTSAGMQPFVPWFRGIVPPAYPRVATCQKSFRADDIDEVGRTPFHATFFEMLGNFSFGDYFKRGAIEYAWEFVTQVLEIPKERIWITVHPEDDEAPAIWRQEIGLPESRIVVDPTNWWGPVGKSGPCGPDTELHWDKGEEFGCADCDPTHQCGRFTELWNLVFQTYHKTEAGLLEPLPKPGIDTGMGFERVCAVLEGVPTIFETDVFAPIKAAVEARARQSNPKLPDLLSEEQQLATRVITDHVRALSFLLADGFTPSNEGAGYVLRRILRIAYRFGRSLGIDRPFLHRLVPTVVATMGDVYPELAEAEGRITAWIEQEEKQFEETLERSYGPLLDAIQRAQAAGLNVLPGDVAFRLYDTYGLPKELAGDLAKEHGLALEEEGFNTAMAEQRARARAHAEKDFAFDLKSGYQSFVAGTRFLGYDEHRAGATVVGLLRDGEEVEELRAGDEGEVFTDQSPFYAEAGGQAGDTGWLEGDGVRAEVLNTYYPVEGAHAHHVRVVEGAVKTGLGVSLRVDMARREAIARAHTATHMLHCVLRRTLGEHALQSGSLVEPDRLRFDFAHFSALTSEQRAQIEEGVVRLALENLDLLTEEKTLEEARALGATALFGEKYGEQVRVVQIGDISMELCGGTHLGNTGAIGDFVIVSEGSIGAGLRRLEALTGAEAHAFLARQRELLHEVAARLNCQPQEVAERLETLQAELRAAHKEIARLQQKTAGALAGDLVAAAQDIGGVRVITAKVENVAGDALRGLADDLIARLGSGIAVLGARVEGRVQLVGSVSKDLVAAGYHAGNLIREAAKIAGGGGGGRPDFAQAGGKNPERLDDALAKVKELVAAQQG